MRRRVGWPRATGALLWALRGYSAPFAVGACDGMAFAALAAAAAIDTSARGRGVRAPVPFGREWAGAGQVERRLGAARAASVALAAAAIGAVPLVLLVIA